MLACWVLSSGLAVAQSMIVWMPTRAAGMDDLSVKSACGGNDASGVCCRHRGDRITRDQPRVCHLHHRDTPIAEEVGGERARTDDAADIVAVIQGLANHLASEGSCAAYDQEASLWDRCTGLYCRGISSNTAEGSALHAP